MKPTLERYAPTAIALHWLIALLILVTLPLGLYMSDLPLSPYKLKLYSWHKWIGITVLMLAIFRVLWRASHTPPRLSDLTPRWQRIASNAVHILLYVLLFAIPLSGWLMSSAKGVQTVWFGVVPLPDLVGKDKALGELLTTVHGTLNYILMGLIVIHIAAAIKYHFIDRDATLRRILPFGKGI